ncbi:hypothetical protein Btru_018765 [Bulinus truncatus]|nr:hypothetical protein Btru_018765 [Bulinus truncatus]
MAKAILSKVSVALGTALAKGSGGGNFSTVALLTTGYAALQDSVITALDMVINCGLLHFLSLVGILTNAVNVLVLYKYDLRKTTSILLFSLSVSDLLCSVLQPIRRLHCLVEKFDTFLASNIRSFTVVYFFPLPDFFVSISILHTSVIAAERLTAVCLPLKVSRMFTPYRVKWLLLFIYAYVSVLMSPTLLLFDFSWTQFPGTNISRGVFTLSQFYRSNYDGLNQYTNAVLTNLLITSTLGATLVSSLIIGVKLTVGRNALLAQLASTTAASKQIKDLKVIKMLLTVCAVNAGVSLPTVVINMFLLYSNTMIQSGSKLYYLLRSVVCVLYQLNACINFVIYISMSSKFASTLNMICHFHRRRTE